MSLGELILMCDSVTMPVIGGERKRENSYTIMSCDRAIVLRFELILTYVMHL